MKDLGARSTNAHVALMNKRQFVIGTASLGAVSAIPTAALANPFGLVALRFIGGLIFNVTYAVFVKLASDHIVARLQEGASPREFANIPDYQWQTYQAQQLSSAAQSRLPTKLGTYFAPGPYQASLAIGGLGGIEVTQDRKLQLGLLEKDSIARVRMDQLRRVLVDSKAELAFGGSALTPSRRVSSNEPLHNLLSVRYFAGSQTDVRNIYRASIEDLGSDIFDPSLV